MIRSLHADGVERSSAMKWTICGCSTNNRSSVSQPVSSRAYCDCLRLSQTDTMFSALLVHCVLKQPAGGELDGRRLSNSKRRGGFRMRPVRTALAPVLKHCCGGFRDAYFVCYCIDEFPFFHLRVPQCKRKTACYLSGQDDTAPDRPHWFMRQSRSRRGTTRRGAAGSAKSATDVDCVICCSPALPKNPVGSCNVFQHVICRHTSQQCYSRRSN